MSVPRFSSVVIDVDSTLCGIEGIDWLATKRGPVVSDAIAKLTDRAMNGEVPLESLYGERLALVKPTAADVDALSRAYVDALAPGARESIFRLRDAGVAVTMVSGGIRQAIRPLARVLGFSDGSLHAVSVSFGDAGEWLGYDESSPMTTQLGKRALVATLGLARPTLAVGDGATDAAMRDAVDAFAAFTGFVRRENVVRSADYVISSFGELTTLVLS